MTRIQTIQAEMKKLREEYMRARAKLEDKLATARADRKAAPPKDKKAKAKPERKSQDTTAEAARRAADAAKERMKNDHPDHGGTSEAFRQSYAQWKAAEARYRAAL